MSADYFSFQPNIEYSQNSDYSQDQVPASLFPAIETRPDSGAQHKQISLSNGGSYVLDLAIFDEIHQVIVFNKSTLYGVQVEWTSDGNAQDPLVNPQRYLVFDTPTPASDITFTATADGAVTVSVLIVGVLAAQ